MVYPEIGDIEYVRLYSATRELFKVFCFLVCELGNGAFSNTGNSKYAFRLFSHSFGFFLLQKVL